ncbi:MAG: hypothetical protein ACFE9S_13205 [Candidatus Hermodarchaeota archaeon]
MHTNDYLDVFLEDISLAEGSQFNMIRNNTIYFGKYCIYEGETYSDNTIINNICNQL